MITRANILTEYPKIDQSILPKPLQSDEFAFVTENIDLADEDEDIGKYIDTFIGKLNEVLTKSASTKTDKDGKSPTERNEEKPFNMTVMAKYRNGKFRAMDVTAGVQVNNLLYASLIKSDRLDELITALKERQSADWQFKIVKTGTSKVLWQSGKDEAPKPKAGKPVSKPKKEKADKPRKAATKNQKSKIENEVTEFPLAVTFIKSYIGWNGKAKTKTQVYTFIKRLQKAITERKIRKASEYAPHIEYMQGRLIAFYNDMKGSNKTYEIPAAKLAELKEKCNMRWADHVVVIKQYINILNDTKTGLKEKAQALLKKIEASEFSATAKDAIASLTKSLKDYLNGKTSEPTINEMALQGLYGLAGLSGLGELPTVPASTIPADNKILSAADFKNASFKLMGFTGKWLQLVGDPSVPFKAMIWGTGGSGKSTLAIELARYLAGTLNKRVLYVANEEGAGATLHEKMTRLNAFHPNLFITKTLPLRLVEYDLVFCDSANSMQMELPKFEQTAKLYPRLSWVLLFQTTKDGKFLGEKNWQHVVDVEVYCENGKARALKSRFGGKEEIEVW